MDRITTSYVKDFTTMQDRAETTESTAFEHFVNYTVLSHEYPNRFDIDDVHTGNSALGIDGIAFVVNGKMVTSPDEVDDLVELNKYLEVQIVFIQSKTSPKFEGTDIGNFLFATKAFFTNSEVVLTTEEMHNFSAISNRILEQFPKMKKGKPKLKLYYVTTGTWKNEASQRAVIDSGTKEIEGIGLFSKVEFLPIDASGVQTMYRKTKEVSQASFTFKDKVTLGEIPGVKEAYLGFLPWNEFSNIVVDDAGNIKNIFYDNVRDYLGENSVNQSIDETIASRKFELFTVLNNGVTIVATDIVTSANKFTITDYQIVNGCQTSHVLYENRTLLDSSNLAVPVRLIVTKDEDVKNDITIATNNQTQVKPEQLEALSKFQKDLEEYYKVAHERPRLYYERRTNQYSSDDSVTRSKVVSIPLQIKTFASMFLDVPHIVSGYYGTIMKNKGDEIFRKQDSHSPYYASALCNNVLETLLRNGSLEWKYRKARFHILMILRVLYAGWKCPPTDSQRLIDPYCQKLVDIVRDEPKAFEAFVKCIEVIHSCGISLDDKRIFKQSETTKRIMDKLRASAGAPAA